MPGRSSERSRQAAAYLKDHQIERTTGMCPMSCGRTIRNGGEALLNHLKVCKGRPRKRNKR